MPSRLRISIRLLLLLMALCVVLAAWEGQRRKAIEIDTQILREKYSLRLTQKEEDKDWLLHHVYGPAMQPGVIAPEWQAQLKETEDEIARLQQKLAELRD